MDRNQSSPADPLHRAFYENMSGRYIPPYTRRGIDYRNHTVARYIGQPGRRVLEVGPGEGWLTHLLTDQGHRVVAVDYAHGWLPALADHRPGAAQADMTRLPFAEASFDVVVAVEVVEHIENLSGALRETARVLAPGGFALVTVPYRETLQYKTCPGCGIRFELSGHVHTFDEESLASALRDAGLDPETTFLGFTRFSREMVRRLPIKPLLPLLNAIDRATIRTQRVTDTWLLMTARRR